LHKVEDEVLCCHVAKEVDYCHELDKCNVNWTLETMKNSQDDAEIAKNRFLAAISAQGIGKS